MEVTHRRAAGPLSESILNDVRLAELAGWGRRLTELGVSPGRSGNLSVRTDAGFLITGTGVPLGTIRPEDWVEVTEVEPLRSGGLRVHSRGPNDPSKDASVHAAIYGRLPGAGAVFHLHPDYLETLTVELAVPTTAAYHPAGTVESVREIERWIEPATRFLVLIDHGIVAWGAGIDEAGSTIESYHHAATGA